MTDQGTVPSPSEGDGDEPGGAAPWWMKAVLAGLPFAILLALLFLDRCRTGG